MIRYDMIEVCVTLRNKKYYNKCYEKYLIFLNFNSLNVLVK